MSSESKGRKRSKAFYRKSAHGGKKQCVSGNRLEPGQRGFLVMCNNNESSAVRESYNILNDYADQLFGQGLAGPKPDNDLTTNEVDDGQAREGGSPAHDSEENDEDEDCDDLEKALKKEVDSMKSQPTEQRRFQNCATKAKNCVFIRTTVADPVNLALTIMEDIAEKKVSRARYAARMLPIIGTCKAHTPDIQQLARKVLPSIFSPENPDVPKSFTVLFKVRNNNSTTCGKMSVIPAITNVVKDINPKIEFSWSDFEVAILVEIVCTVCCLGVAPKFTRLRKYNFQELLQGPKVPEVKGVSNSNDPAQEYASEVLTTDSTNTESVEASSAVDSSEKNDTMDTELENNYGTVGNSNLNKHVDSENGKIVVQDKPQEASELSSSVDNLKGEEGLDLKSAAQSEPPTETSIESGENEKKATDHINESPKTCEGNAVDADIL